MRSLLEPLVFVNIPKYEFVFVVFFLRLYSRAFSFGFRNGKRLVGRGPACRTEEGGVTGGLGAARRAWIYRVREKHKRNIVTRTENRYRRER